MRMLIEMTKDLVVQKMTEAFTPAQAEHVHAAVKHVQERSKAHSAEYGSVKGRFNDDEMHHEEIAKHIISKKNFGNKTTDHMYDNHKISPGFMKAVKERYKETADTAGVTVAASNSINRTNARSSEERRTAGMMSYLSKNNKVGRLR